MVFVNLKQENYRCIRLYMRCFFEEVTINGVTGLVHRTSATLYSINGLGTVNFRAPRLSSYKCRKNIRKCIFNYYKPGVKIHDTHNGNICIRDISAFKGDKQ